MITLAIDATNLKTGGGRTHLLELLYSYNEIETGIDRIVVFAEQETCDFLGNFTNVKYVIVDLQKFRNIKKLFWYKFTFNRLLKQEQCNAVFFPGGSVFYFDLPSITMCRNLLPFKLHEASRYGLSWLFFKMIILRILQRYSFDKCDGLIFLNQYARNTVYKGKKKKVGLTAVIPHGVNSNFKRAVADNIISGFLTKEKLKFVYVSQIENYKHQINVLKAFARLRAAGYNIDITFIGPAREKPLKVFMQALSDLDQAREWSYYRGGVAYRDLPGELLSFDAAIFMSSCENMPNTLLEKMLSGVPLVCSSRKPMSDIMPNDTSFFADPDSIDEIEGAIKLAYEKRTRAIENAVKAQTIAENYTWKKCCSDTFGFIEQVIQNRNNSHNST